MYVYVCMCISIESNVNNVYIKANRETLSIQNILLATLGIEEKEEKKKKKNKSDAFRSLQKTKKKIANLHACMSVYM